MRPVNIVLLVLAGAIGGAVVMKVTQRPVPAQIAEAKPPERGAPLPATAPPAAAQPQASAAAVEEAPVTTAEPVESSAVEPKGVAARPTRAWRPRAPKRAEFQHRGERQVIAKPSPAPMMVAQVQPPAAPTPSAPAAVSAPPPPAEQPQDAPPARLEPENPTPVPAQIPSAPEPPTVTLNAGMLIPVRLVDSLSLDRNRAGDRFAATLDRELVADGFVIAERGARVEGKVVTADRASRTLSVELNRVETSDRQSVAIQTERFDKHDEPDRGQDAAKVGAGAVIGAVIGGMAGGGKGAAIGAGVGGGAGAGSVMLSRKPVTLPSETRITFSLRAPVTITERRD